MEPDFLESGDRAELGVADDEGAERCGDGRTLHTLTIVEP
jgi:hypothetical protein